MDITPYLFRKMLLIRVEMTGGGMVRKELATIRYAKGKASLEEMKSFELDALSKWKNSPVLLLVTGEQVVSKPYIKEDPSLKRITSNPELLWDIEDIDGQEPILSFLRKDVMSELLQAVKQHHLFLMDIWISNFEHHYDVQVRLNDLYRNRFKSCALLKSPDSKSVLADILFHRIFMPVLLLFFALLLGNYFLHSYYTKQFQQKQAVIQLDKKLNRKNSSEEQQKNQLMAAYNQIPNQSFALLADRVASYIPPNLYLTSMSLFPPAKNINTRDKKTLPMEYHTARLKGSVETPGSVTLLIQLLEADNLFEKVKVIQLDRRKNSSVFEFELEITL